MNPRRALAVWVLVAAAGHAGATDVRFRLIDQSGARITSSSFYFGTGTVREERVVTLEPGTYRVRVRPGILEQFQFSFLHRDDTVLIQGPEQVVELVWITAPLQLNLRDQDGAELPGTLWAIPGFAALLSGSTTSARLPVTVDPGGKPLGGVFNVGYPIEIFPGMLGLSQDRLLVRVEPVQELTDAGGARHFEWRTGRLTLELRDETGQPVFGSRFAVPGFPIDIEGPSVRVRLPLTEDPTQAFVSGPFAQGYPLTVVPGIMGPGRADRLSRQEPPLPLAAEEDARVLVWPHGTLDLAAVDRDGLPVEGSSFAIPGAGTLPGPMASVRLPVTDDPGAAPAEGLFAGGYPLELRPGIAGKSQSGALQRVETARELVAAGDSRQLTWDTARGTLHVVGADGDEIEGAALRLPGFIAEQATGEMVILPVNEIAGDPPPEGTLAGGYPFELRLRSGVPLDGPFTFVVGPGQTVIPAFVDAGEGLVGLRFDLCTSTASADGDTVADCLDNCPESANDDQADVDADGVGDACDNCPFAAPADQSDLDGDGAGNRCDNCPDLPNASQSDADGDAVGDPCDNCPATGNAGQTDIDGDGTGNACDLDDGLIHVRGATPALWQWEEESGFVSWNVYRGDLAALRDGGDLSQVPGSNPLAARFCALQQAALEDPLAPEAGAAAFYLVSGVGIGEGGLGTDGSGTPRPHAHPCP